MITQAGIGVQVSEGSVPVTGFSGVVGLSRMAEGMGLFSDAQRHLGWVKQRRRGYAVSAMLFDLMMLPCAGGSCIDDLAALRADAGLSRLLGRKARAPSTAHDFLRALGPVGLEGLAAVRRGQLAHVARAAGHTVATLDCDASLFVSKAQQAQRSYTGERGWFPMLAFWAEAGMVVHEEFRQGNASPQADAVEFLKEAVAQLPRGIERVYVRSDSAWYQAALLDHCHEHGYGFAVTADRDEAVKAGLMHVDEAGWVEIDAPAGPGDGVRRQWACEAVHTLNGSKHPYRMVYLRRERQQGDLFEGMYAYGAIITNREELSTQELVRWHRQRCNAENHIKELKHGFGLESLPSAGFFVNAVYLRILTLAFNLIAAFKRLALPQGWAQHTLNTLRLRLLAVPALVVRHARRLHLRLARGWPWRDTLLPLLA
jgi:hypothetical protein